MAIVKTTVMQEIDGIPVPGSPYVREDDVDESQVFSYEEANDGDETTFSVVPMAQLATIKTLFIKPDQEVTIRLDGQTDSGIKVAAGGILVIAGATIDSGAGASNCSANNNSGSTALLKGGGSGT